MTEIQVTLNSRSVERFFFIIIILALGFMNVWQWTHESGVDSMTAKVTENTQLAPVNNPPVADPAAESCSDGIMNQDEDAVDCGGVCGGYYYDGLCNSEPKQAPDNGGSTSGGADIECRLNSDCDSGFKCEDSKCVEIPPECEEDDDCEFNEECSEGKCEEKRLTGTLDAQIVSVEVKPGTGENTKKVTAAKLKITNGKGKTLVLYGKAFVFEDRSDPMYNVAQGGEFEIGDVRSGETIEKFVTIGGVSFPDDDEKRDIRIEIYDSDTEDKLDTLTKNVYP